MKSLLLLFVHNLFTHSITVVEIIAAEACPDHIHMLIRIPPKCSVSQIMGYLKGKSSLMIFDRHASLKSSMGIGISRPEDTM